MDNLLFISNMGKAKITINFCGASISVSHRLGLNWFMAINKSLSNKEQIEKENRELGITQYHADIARNPLSIKNIGAYKQIVGIIRKDNIEFIHCNTPTGGLLGRLAGAHCNVKKIIYQVHGFHFYKGAPVKNWLVYYPIERLLAHKTDAIITINTEDFEAARKLRLRKGGKVYYVPGVGIDTSKYIFDEAVRTAKRAELGLNESDFAFIVVGELNKNKNNTVLINALSMTKSTSIHLFFCGIGNEKDNLVELAERLDISPRVHFLGYRNDVAELYSASDGFLMASLREGLSRSIMEAMSMGLPCVVSDIRGNRDLIENGKQGYLCSPKSAEEFARAMDKIAFDELLRKKMSVSAKEKIKQFDVSVVEKELEKIYTEVFNLKG